MSRTIIIGDVHGCADELKRLFDHLGLVRSDRVVMVGDLLVRGPDPAGTMQLLHDAGALSVRGNHEDRLLRWKAQNASLEVVSELQRVAIRALKKRDWEYLESLPLWLDLPEHNLRVVHAGVLPNVTIERQNPRVLMYMRTVGPLGEPLERRGAQLWGELYQGPVHIVFGHNAQPRPQFHPFATGIDTGAVYGGRLTAMVLREGEQPPPPTDRADVLVSVESKRRYFGR